uniref:Uncharacterized protein n=1 Tax=Rhizophagus irregularis (strain DAOM 181602 / DAOM 197198 / MUCL 43194) TaxID=747089 RepID=U9TT64_RHIID
MCRGHSTRGIIARHTRYLLDYLNNKSTKNVTSPYSLTLMLKVDLFFKEGILLARYGNVLAPEREDFILRY